MPDLIDSIARQAAVGQAAPAPMSKQQPGNASPAGNGKDVGTTSTQAEQDALVAAKKQAEHWRNKYERDIGDSRDTRDRLAKLEGMAQGMSSAQPTPAAPPKTFGDLDDTGLSEVVKRAMEDNQPSLITETIKEHSKRAAEKAGKEAEERAYKRFEGTMAQQRVAAQITREFGADASNEESGLRLLADAYLHAELKLNPKLLETNPGVLLTCFKAARADLLAGESGELERLRKAEADRTAREEIERSRQTISTKAREDVKELLDKNDVKGAIKSRLSRLY